MDFKLQQFGPLLHWLTLIILCIAPVLVAFVIYRLGSLPGAIARSRNHPQAEAIGICGWMGIITIVLWPVAMVWAYLVPGRPITGPEPGAVEDRAALTARLQQVSQRIAAIEGKLPKPTTGGA
jgi:cytochrome b561